MKYLFLLTAAIVVLSCTTQKRQSSQSNTNIDTIKYETTACFGTCPMFKLTIDKDRNAVMDAHRFTFTKDRNGEREGIFTATIKEADYNKLITLLKRADLKSLGEKLGNRMITDMPTAHLHVSYTDGHTKKIEDYGKRGTPELANVYSFVDSLRYTQEWKRR